MAWFDKATALDLSPFRPRKGRGDKAAAIASSAAVPAIGPIPAPGETK